MRSNSSSSEPRPGIHEEGGSFSEEEEPTSSLLHGRSAEVAGLQVSMRGRAARGTRKTQRKRRSTELKKGWKKGRSGQRAFYPRRQEAEEEGPEAGDLKRGESCDAGHDGDKKTTDHCLT